MAAQQPGAARPAASPGPPLTMRIRRAHWVALDYVLAAVRPLATDERRRPYQITAAGQEILAEQVTTMQQIVRVARLRTALAWGA